MVDSSDRRSRYKTRSQDARAAKLFARWDGPYEVVECFPDSSTYRLNLPFADRSHPVFHASKLKAYHTNKVEDFPAHEPPRPEQMDVEGEEEYIVEAIVDEKGRGRSRKDLVDKAKPRGPDTSKVIVRNLVVEYARLGVQYAFAKTPEAYTVDRCPGCRDSPRPNAVPPVYIDTRDAEPALRECVGCKLIFEVGAGTGANLVANGRAVMAEGRAIWRKE
ncbi:hypothetical protein JCM10296v2_005001 [Rhodotorula toruloides]